MTKSGYLKPASNISSPKKTVGQSIINQSNQDWILGFLLLLVTFSAYQPSWNGKPIWDDNHHITRPDLRSTDGLARIWTQLGATQQYYPLVHSVFWLEHHLWADSTLGYHLVNILLHFFSALLLVCIMRRLMIPGAWFIAAIFALHPVQVESVAWITELKNTLSGVFFLSATLVYLHFDQERKKKLYAVAMGLFVLGLMSKSAIATLPVSLLVVFWWKRGRIDWKNDLVPLLPFFVMGIAYGLFTAWVEHRFIIGDEGKEFTVTTIERCLIAGRAFCFYLGKLFWPVDLVFIYPRWNVNQSVWWQYLFPFATLILAGVLWKMRNRSRAPLAALLYFMITLFPALGFINVYPFRYSFVADHFQYLACIGPIALAVGTGSAFGLLSGKMRTILCMIFLLMLSILTWRQSKMYTDLETLYRITIQKNPNCFMAHNNLGLILAETGRMDEAIPHYRRALEDKRDFAEARNNLGNALLQTGRPNEAIVQYQKALEIKPRYAEAHNNIANALLQIGRIDEAASHFQTALRIYPNFSDAYSNYGLLLEEIGQTNEAVVYYRRALEINPNFAEAQKNLGTILAKRGLTDEGIFHLVKALEIDPRYIDAHNNLGNVLLKKGRTDEALFHFKKALEIDSNKISTLQNLAGAYAQRKQVTDAIPLLQRALALAKAAEDETQVKGIAANLETLNQSARSAQ